MNVAYPAVPAHKTESRVGVARPIDGTEPTIGAVDAEDLCYETYPSRSEALGVARRLRAAGWVVVEHDGRPSYRPDGLSIAATVYHPHTYDSPGDLLAAS